MYCYCNEEEIPGDSPRGQNITLHTNIMPITIFFYSFFDCYHTAYVYMKIEKGGYHHVYSYTL